MTQVDAVVVGAGPNGLAAAIRLAQAGCAVLLVEGKDTLGGGMRTLEVTEPGYRHDICSAIHPLGLASPFLQQLPLADYGLEWIHPQAPVAHPLDGGRAAIIEHDFDATAETLGPDGAAYRRLMAPFAHHYDRLLADFHGPLRLPPYPLMMARFGVVAPLPAVTLARLAFRGEEARAAFAGIAAHSTQPLERMATGAAGLLLGAAAHAGGWPLAKGGSQTISDALAAHFVELGGTIQTGWMVTDIAELPPAEMVLFNVIPRDLLTIMGDRLPARYRRQLENFRHGPGVFKIDYALSEPVPWANPAVARAGTVHLGGTLAEVADSERQMWNGTPPERPYVLVAQQSLFDATRAPEGRHTLWAYCHVPHGCTVDMTQAIEDQIERFAPGFRDCVIARATRDPAQMEAYNPNYIGGDVGGGVLDLPQIFTRPAVRPSPYSTPVDGVYLCSSSTPPGGGVHGMCGFYAAEAALRHHA
ncbi:MAG: NAD(P)/FAD-dependent oxidoreductase [Chloroflexi bacterium]|nr:NAD(P)/FAD-dependent oxidoreductase [Chloroflexota bacterium]